MTTHPDKILAIGAGIATNIDAADGNPADPWLLLAPYGETPYWYKDESGQARRLRQVFTREQAGRMVAAFNALATKKGQRFRGLPIYAGHPDADPHRWPDERRLGGVVDLDARADGLYVRAAWNDLGEQNRAQGYLVYPSPAWLYDRAAANGIGVIAPDELRSVGLTNTPRLPDVPAWTNADPEIPNPFDQTTDTSMNYKDLLLEHFGLPAEATDEHILHAHNVRREERARTEAALLVVRSERDQARDEAGRFRKTAVNAQLDAAINAGRLAPSEREGFIERFERDFEAAVRELGERRLTLNTHGLGLRPAALGVDLNTPHGRATAFNARLDALMRPVVAGGRGLKFDAAITEMRASSEDAALLRAMEGK